jgi:hypothetical protein
MRREVTDDPMGDFINDARGEIAKGKMPVIRTRKELYGHLAFRACQKVLDMVPEIWTEFASTAKPKKEEV